MTTDRNARLQERAYHIWLEEGRPHGRHDEHWHRAERELIEEERGRREGLPVTGSRDAAAATTGAPEASAEIAAPPQTESRAEGRREPAVAEPAEASHSRAKSQAPDHSKADRSNMDQAESEEAGEKLPFGGGRLGVPRHAAPRGRQADGVRPMRSDSRRISPAEAFSPGLACRRRV